MKVKQSKVFLALLLSLVMMLPVFSMPTIAAENDNIVHYLFDNDVAGDGAGTISVKAPTTNTKYDSFVLYWGDENGKLQDYTSIITLSKVQAELGYRMVNCLAIPKGATRIVAYLKNGDQELNESYSYALPANKVTVDEKPLTTMFFISDIHIDYADSILCNNFEHALDDIKAIDSKASAIVVNGDIANQGLPYQYALEKELVAKHADGLPPIYYNIGNHDTWDKTDGKTGSENYTAATGNPLRYDVTVAGQHLIFLGGISAGQGVDIKLTEEDLQWLDAKLAEDAKAGQQSFVFIHQGVSNTVTGTFEGQWMYHHIQNESEFKSVLSKYPSAVFVSGHSHVTLDARLTALNGLASSPSYINDSSTAYLTIKDNDVYTGADDDDGTHGSQGIYVEIYKDKIILRGREFKQEKWISRSNLKLDLINKDTKLADTTTISGMPVVGNSLTAHVNNLVSGVNENDLTYTWYADTVKCGEGKTYRVDKDVLGKKISVKVRDSKTGRFSGAECSDATTENGYATDYTTLYLDKGAITIGDNAVSGFDQNGKEITTANAKGYIITQSAATSDNQVTITGGKHNLIMQHVNLVSDKHNFKIDGNADVTLTLRGENDIHYGKDTSSAALEVTGDASLTINGTPRDHLVADHSQGGRGAGIGGTIDGACGNITINGGDIAATGGTCAAGIGGSKGTTKMGKITINGGRILAKVYLTSAPGIGSGWCPESQVKEGSDGEIEINGGVIIAQGGYDEPSWSPYGAGCGIGAGPNDHLKKITINGGNVDVMCGSGNISGTVNDIGNSGIRDNTTLDVPATPVIINGGNIIAHNNNLVNAVNQDGDAVAVKTLSTGLISTNVTLDINGVKSAARTEQDGSLYVYYPIEKDTVITATTEKGKTVATANIKATAAVGTLKDIKGHWAYDAIMDMVDKGIVKGNTDGTFQPNKAATRAEFAQMTAKAFGYESTKTESVFTDVKPADWYFKSVTALTDSSIISGVSQTNFAPQTTLTREQMAAILYRVLSDKKVALTAGKTASFHDDTSIAPWAKEAVYTLQENGIVSGRENGTFDPQGSATKAEIASMLQRVLKLTTTK